MRAAIGSSGAECEVDRVAVRREHEAFDVEAVDEVRAHADRGRRGEAERMGAEAVAVRGIPGEQVGAQVVVAARIGERGEGTAAGEIGREHALAIRTQFAVLRVAVRADPVQAIAAARDGFEVDLARLAAAGVGEAERAREVEAGQGEARTVACEQAQHLAFVVGDEHRGRVDRGGRRGVAGAGRERRVGRDRRCGRGRVADHVGREVAGRRRRAHADVGVADAVRHDAQLARVAFAAQQQAGRVDDLGTAARHADLDRAEVAAFARRHGEADADRRERIGRIADDAAGRTAAVDGEVEVDRRRRGIDGQYRRAGRADAGIVRAHDARAGAGAGEVEAERAARVLGVVECRGDPAQDRVGAERRSRRPGTDVLRAERARERLVAVGETIDRLAVRVVEVNDVVAAEAGRVHADHLDAVAEAPGGAERVGGDVGQQHRFTGLQAAERAERHAAGQVAVVVETPAGHVDGLVADVGELDELAVGALVHVFGDAHDAAQRHAGRERMRGARAEARAAEVAAGRGARVLGIAERRGHPCEHVVAAERRGRHPGADVLGAERARERLVAEREAIDERVAAVVEVDHVVAAEADRGIDEDACLRAQPPGLAERVGGHVGHDHRLAGTHDAEVAERDRAGQGAVVVEAPAAHVDRRLADVREFHEFAVRALVHVFGDAHLGVCSACEQQAACGQRSAPASAVSIHRGIPVRQAHRRRGGASGRQSRDAA